jgi:hypothetical protein
MARARSGGCHRNFHPLRRDGFRKGKRWSHPHRSGFVVSAPLRGSVKTAMGCLTYSRMLCLSRENLYIWWPESVMEALPAVRLAPGMRFRVSSVRSLCHSCSFAPSGLGHFPLGTHGLCRGLQPYVASRLNCVPPLAGWRVFIPPLRSSRGYYTDCSGTRPIRWYGGGQECPPHTNQFPARRWRGRALPGNSGRACPGTCLRVNCEAVRDWRGKIPAARRCLRRWRGEQCNGCRWRTR